MRLFAATIALLTMCGAAATAAPGVNLDQGKNGEAVSPISPVQWANGNLNSSQSHYLEGYSIPYRLIMTDLPTDGTEIVLTMAYDVTHGGRHAIDFLTHYACMDDPDHILYFGHGPESVEPLNGITLVGVDASGLDDSVTDTTAIASPPGTGTVSYALTQPGAGFADSTLGCGTDISIWGATFSSDSGPEFAYTDNDGLAQAGDLNDAQSEQLFTVRFKATSPTVVMAWGGHIASRYHWGKDEFGEPYSAGALSGSPYHMRVIDWNLGNLGNQDRSLSASAVVDIEDCDLLGPDTVCHDNSVNNFTVITDATSITWEIIDGTYADAAFVGDPANQTTATISSPGPNTGTFTVRVTVGSGESGNVCEYPVEVVANPVPSITGDAGPVCPSATDLEYSGPDGMVSYKWSVSGDASIVGDDTLQTVTIATDAVCEGSFTLTLEVSNGDCSDSDSIIVVVDDTEDPVLVGVPADAEAECSAIPDAPTVTATDNCDSDMTVNFSEIRSGECGSEIITRTWTVSDDCGNTASASQVISLTDSSAPVLSDYPADINDVACDNIPDAPVLTATDNCATDLEVSYQETDLRDPVCGTGIILRTWTVTDCYENLETHTQTLTVIDETKPTLSGYPADATVECSAIPPVPLITAADNCDSQVDLAFNETDNRDSECGTGSIIRTWVATDCSNNILVWEQVLTVVDTTAPVLDSKPGDATVECDAIPSAPDVGATDNCDTAVDVVLVEVDGRSAECGTGTITRTWTATDCAGNTDVHTQTLTVVDNTDPTLDSKPADDTVECDAIPSAPDVTASDNCDTDVAVVLDEVKNLGDCGTGTIERTWTATDCAGNTDVHTQVLTVVDTTPPVVIAPDDVYFECDGDISGLAQVPPTISDNCDLEPDVVYNETVEENTDCGYVKITRSWTVTDCSGNSASAVQVLEVGDRTPPVLTMPADVINTCDDCPTDPDTTGRATAVDNCDGEVEVDFYDEVIGDCPTEIRRTWFATDCVGNLVEEVQRITCVGPNDVTDSSLCIFDRDPYNDFEQDFRLLFTPDIKHAPYYKISSTNPGQLFYNVFYKGTPGDEITLDICIPYPYVTHGANPIHVYDWVYLEECDGGVGFVPGNAVYSEKTYITLDDYPAENPYGTQVCLKLTITVPDTGFAYLNIHLEHGLPGTGGYSRDVDHNAFDLVSGAILVPHQAEHWFSVEGDVTGEDVIHNLNDFKGGPGVAGTVTSAATGDPIAGCVVVFRDPRGRIDITQETDANGAYFIPFVHQGKPTTYQLWMITPSGNYIERNVFMKKNWFSQEDFSIQE